MLKRIRFFELVVIIFIALLLISEGLIYVPSLSGKIIMTESMTHSGNNVSVDTTIKSTFNANLEESYYITSAVSNFSRIYFYFDSSYPTSNSTVGNWYGLSQHFEAVARVRGLNLNIIMLNATQLASFLKSQSSLSDTLVIASGVLPETVYSKQINLVKPWIDSGGTVVWIGSKIGLFSGSVVGNSGATNQLSLIKNGPDTFISPSLFGGVSTYYSNSSSISSSFGINYGYALSGNGIDTTELKTIGGLTVGNIDGGYTSISVIPSNKGRIVYFSGPLFEDTSTSISMMNILQSNLVCLVMELKSSTFVVDKNEVQVSNTTISVPSIYIGTGYYFCHYVVQSDYLATYSSLKFTLLN